jgi:hypothetical protein
MEVHARRAVAAHLTQAGFDVYQCEELDIAGAFRALVLMSNARTTSSALNSSVRSYIKRTRSLRIVVLTWRTDALTNLIAVHGERLAVLSPYALGREVLDALGM